MYSAPTQVCGMSPMNLGARGSRHTTSPQLFQPVGRTPSSRNSSSSWACFMQAHPDQRADDPELVGRVALELGSLVRSSLRAVK